MAEEFALPLKLGLTSAKGPLGGSLPHYNVYEAADGWVAVAALEPHFLARLLSAMGLEKPDFADFRRIFRTRSCSEWQRIAKTDDIPLTRLSKF
jgi:crotonobetainyl-CoA:carnitine CoA-transferase CaiB-like acyl-CoA transferase